MIENRISLEITSAQKTAVEDARAALANVVKNFDIQIDKEELKSMSKISDGRLPFVEKIAQYAASNPEFLPPYADIPEFTKDFQVFKDLREMIRPMRRLLDNLENSMMVSGSESYDFARAYYKSVQYNAKTGVPGAQTIYDDLRPLFEAKTTDAKPPTE